MCHGLHTKLAGIVSHRARKRNRTFVQLHRESLSVAAPHYFQAWAVANDAPRRASSRGNGNKTESKLASSVLREWITAQAEVRSIAQKYWSTGGRRSRCRLAVFGPDEPGGVNWRC
jgi:hypothetical protein